MYGRATGRAEARRGAQPEAMKKNLDLNSTASFFFFFLFFCLAYDPVTTFTFHEVVVHTFLNP